MLFNEAKTLVGTYIRREIREYNELGEGKKLGIFYCQKS